MTKNKFSQSPPSKQEKIMEISVKILISTYSQNSQNYDYLFGLDISNYNYEQMYIMVAKSKNIDQILDSIGAPIWLKYKNTMNENYSKIDESLIVREKTLLERVNILFLKIALKNIKYDALCVLSGIVGLPRDLLGDRYLMYDITKYSQKASLEQLNMLEFVLVQLLEPE